MPYRFLPAEDVSATAQGWMLSLLMAADPTVQSKYIAPRTRLLLRRGATGGPNSNPVICNGLGRRCSAGIMSFWISSGKF
jgi:hypothetical protein